MYNQFEVIDKFNIIERLEEYEERKTKQHEEEIQRELRLAKKGINFKKSIDKQ